MDDGDDTTRDLIDDASDRTTENPSLGTHLGYEVHIAIRRDPPGTTYPDDFAVTLYIPREDGTNVDIARVDTSGGLCHIDRLYLPEGHDQRKHDEGFSTLRPEGAVTYATDEERWREWVERYEQNHGLP